jgi:hypothetical protein
MGHPGGRFVWDGHSCPSLLTLVLILLVSPFFWNAWFWLQLQTKVNGDGQECPSHIFFLHIFAAHFFNDGSSQSQG